MSLYKCICGREFTSPNSFNGHKSHCKEHLTFTGRLELRKTIDQTRGPKVGALLKYNNLQRKNAQLQQWITENHTCKYCGNLMIEKYGKGDFCNRSCANYYASNSRGKDVNERISQKLKNKIHPRELEYLQNPKLCCICNNPISYELRKRKTCGNKECVSKLLSNKSSIAVQQNGGNNNPYGVKGTAKYGTYQGFHCDSSYELAFVIYCLDHNIPIKRNSESFEYYYEEKLKFYYPDFIVNSTYIEIKNYITDQVEAKKTYFPTKLNYKILFKKDLQPCFTYCKDTYGKDWITLYDRNYPSWMDKLNNDKNSEDV